MLKREQRSACVDVPNGDSPRVAPDSQILPARMPDETSRREISHRKLAFDLARVRGNDLHVGAYAHCDLATCRMQSEAGAGHALAERAHRNPRFHIHELHARDGLTVRGVSAVGRKSEVLRAWRFPGGVRL